LIPTGSPAFAQKNLTREAYFGEQHVHTSWSLDASLGFGDMVAGPEDFYKYALGQPMTHVGGYKVKITKPLDWGATTEHAEYLGVYPQVLDPNSPVRKHAPFLSEAIKAGGRADGLLTYKLLSVTLVKGHPIKELKGPEVLAPVWKRLVEIADKYYRPGKFTTFAAYEWTSTPNGANLHRNIFFKDSRKVPEMPFSAIDSSDPIDLWNWMDGQRKAGNELLGAEGRGLGRLRRDRQRHRQDQRQHPGKNLVDSPHGSSILSRMVGQRPEG